MIAGRVNVSSVIDKNEDSIFLPPLSLWRWGQFPETRGVSRSVEMSQHVPFFEHPALIADVAAETAMQVAESAATRRKEGGKD